MSRLDGIGQHEAWRLWMAALHGNAELALELEKLGIASEDGDESLKEAAALRPMILEMVEAIINHYNGRHR